jgi:hypothetical protein
MIANRQAYTELSHATIVSRYVLSLEVNRGPSARGSASSAAASRPRTWSASTARPCAPSSSRRPRSASIVPALAPGRTYKVTLSSAAGNSAVGTFRIDSSDVTVDPAALSLAPGQKQTLTFTFPIRRPRAASCSMSRRTCPKA